MTEARWWTSIRAPLDVLDERFRAYTRDEVQVLKDHWLLGLEPGASQEEIVQAFRFKAKQFHPDRLIGEPTNIQDLASREFHRIHEAFNRLRTS
jgi:DnaJ like chaperone protein